MTATPPPDSPPPPIRVVAAVLRQRDRYLVCRRPANKRHGGLWEFPGGKAEPGESDLEAARRELLEELGVHVAEVGAELFAVNDPGSEFLIAFVPVKITGEPAANEHDALQWAGVADLQKLDLAPSDRRFTEWLCAQASMTCAMHPEARE